MTAETISALRTLGVVQTYSARCAPAMPTHAGKAPPCLEKFDIFNFGERQLDVGKILPPLPEVAKVGKLLLFKHGPYNPHPWKVLKVLVEGMKVRRGGPI
ncbi:unnamed protein product [Heligmosomoides polygyrus]|uniref:COesterase domain-containing protein n=1 Tax=Heligmosomoides polygyrus TaxID=6339 RepID=A0A183FRG2_HELPZ|nr:unnamed protein product [Heligmosomoides polygyrus]